ncbi:unnamed protein product [Agarophyton chilense]
MKLFSRKKKASKAEAEAVARQRAVTQQAEAAAAAAAAVAENERKKAEAQRKREEARQIEDHTVEAIIAKQKQIQQLQRALNGFEEQRQREAKLALRARDSKKLVEMKSHLRQVNRLKARIQQYETMHARSQDQLAALEDAASHRQRVEAEKEFATSLNRTKLDVDQVEESLQQAHEAQSDVDEVNRLFQADANLNPSSSEMMDYEAELDGLAAEFSEPVANAIPSVPDSRPSMPQIPNSVPVAPVSTEEDDIRRLEQEVAL